MFMSSRRIRPCLMMLAGAVALAQFAAVEADARDGRQRQAHKRAHGDYTQQTQVQRNDNGRTRTDTWTGAEGRSVNRSATTTNDPASRTRTRDVLWQGPQGQSTTRNATVVNDPESRSQTRTVTVDRPDGG